MDYELHRTSLWNAHQCVELSFSEQLVLSMSLKTLIYKLLVKYPELGDSDRLLVWKVWEMQGIASDYMSKHDFISKAEHFKNVRRTRQQIQEEYPGVRSSDRVQDAKDELADMKGNHVVFTDTSVDWDAMRQELIQERIKKEVKPQEVLF